MSEAALRGGESEAGLPPLLPAHPSARTTVPAVAEQLLGEPILVDAGGALRHATPATAAALQQPAGGGAAPAGVPAAGGWHPDGHNAGAAWLPEQSLPQYGMAGMAESLGIEMEVQQTALGGQPAAAEEPAGAAGSEPSQPPLGLHHLTRHWLPEEARGEAVLQRLGAPDIRTAEHMIRTMGQRDLRDAFQRVYGAATQSFNNTWLRRKLAEALGVKAGGASKSRKRGGGGRGTAKRAAGSGSRPASRGRVVGDGAGTAARPSSRATVKAALAVSMAEADELYSEQEEEEEGGRDDFDDDSEFWSDLTPPSAGFRPGSAGRPSSSGRGSSGLSVPHVAAAAAAAGAAPAGGSGGDGEGTRRSSRQSARRDAQAAAVLHDFAGGLLSAAEQLRTPNPPTLPPAPAQLTELQPGWGAQAPTAAEMQHWRHEWRKRHPPETGGDERQRAASPRQRAASPGAYQSQHAQHAQQAQQAPMLQSVSRQFLHQCTMQLAAHQQQAALLPAQPSSAGQLPLFVGGGTISPRYPPPLPPTVAAAAAAAQAAAAGAALPPPAQQAAVQAPAFEFASPLPPGTVQQLPQAVAAVAQEAQQAAEAAAAAAALGSLPPFPMAAQLAGLPPPPPAGLGSNAGSEAAPVSLEGLGVVVPVTAGSLALPPLPEQLVADMAAESATAAATAAAPASPPGLGVIVPVVTVDDTGAPAIHQPVGPQPPQQLAQFGQPPALGAQPASAALRQPLSHPAAPHAGVQMQQPQVPAQPLQRQAPAGSN